MKLESSLEEQKRRMFEPYVKSFFGKDEDYSKFEMVRDNGIYMIHNEEEERGYILGHGEKALALIDEEREKLSVKGYNVFILKQESLRIAEFKKTNGEDNGSR